MVRRLRAPDVGFDAELVLRARRRGDRIAETPVNGTIGRAANAMCSGMLREIMSTRLRLEWE